MSRAALSTFVGVTALATLAALAALASAQPAAGSGSAATGSGASAPAVGSGSGSGAGPVQSTSTGDGAAATGSGAEGGSATDANQILTLEGAEIPDFDKIRTPDSPAFTLLGVTPTQIERPTTPKELTAVVSKFVSEGDVVIPKNFAAEIAPFALLAHGIDANTYLNRDVGTQMYQNITVSFATASSTRDVTDASGMTTSHADSTLGIGVRTMTTLSGTQEAGCSDLDLESLVAISKLEAVSSTPAGRELQQRTMKALAAATTPEQIEQIKRELEAQSLVIKNDLVRKSDKLASLCIKEVASAHRGWVMDLAAAAGFAFPDSTAKEGRYSLGAAWADVAYEASRASLVLLGRARDDKSSGAHEVFTDLGVRGILAHAAYAGSVEAIWRARLSKADVSTSEANTFRLALALDIHLTDASWLTLSFGRDFAGSEAGSLFTLANVKYGVGDPKVKLKR